MDIKEAYKVMQRASGIKVGDRVRVLRTNRQEELGTDAPFHSQSELDRSGTEGVVLKMYSSEINLKMDSGKCFNMPFFVLEIIESAKVIELKYFCDGEDVTDSISDETKRNLQEN